MDIAYQQQAYRQIEEILNKHQRQQSNLALISLPGLGLSHYLELYAARHPKVAYINQNNQTLKNFNLLDLHFDINPQASLLAEEYFKSAQTHQKFTLAINNPIIIENKSINQFNFWRHIYSTYFIKTLDESDAKNLISRLKIKLNPKQFQQIYQISQGIPQLLKFFAINDQNYTQTELEKILLPITQITNQCSDQTLAQFGLTRTGLLAPSAPNPNFNLILNFDLTFSENNQLSPTRLTKEEKQILQSMLDHQGQITREQIADIKWGPGKYDTFSDQAINKSMRRLNSKLNYYQIITIPKTGYQLAPK